LSDSGGKLENSTKITPTEEAGQSYEITMRQGDLVDQILEEEAHWRPDLIVLAIQRHRDFLDTLRTSTTERVLRMPAALF
jgi:nucleotide-binding universal stress UspA family protein